MKFCDLSTAKGMIVIMKEELIKVTIDRPMGSGHPDYPDMIYPINYGYVKGIMAPDGEEQDAYVIGVDKPVHEYIGKLIAIIHRNDDIEEKWVVCAENVTFSKEEIEKLTYFQEQYYDSYIEMI
ncbi:inorganic diphosphatase [Clostridium mobile]|nr:inorganic diphosphatase [Clostridium mobile]